MTDLWLDKIVKKVEKEQKDSANKSAFDTSTLPTKVIGRITETEQLVKYLLDYKNGHVVPLVSIFGRSGTGKSTLVKYVCNHIKEVNLCFVNLRKAKTVFGGANLTLNALDKPSLKSAQGMNLALENIKQGIMDSFEKQTRLLVLALDEFDVLFFDKRGNPSDFVYKLIEMQSELKEEGFLFMVFTISNNVLTDYELADRVRSRIGNSEIFFKPYSRDETLDILRQRAKDAFTKKIEPKVLEQCANLSYLEHGDARRAVDLLRVASDIATKEKKEISVNHVKKASERLQKDRVEEVISTLSYHSKLALIALAKKTYGLDQDWHSTNSLYESYKKMIETQPVSYRRFSELLTDLENTGLVEPHLSSRGHRGRKAEYMLLVMPELVGKITDEKWWNETVVKKKKSWDKLNDGTITRSNSMYNAYLKIKNEQKDYW
jgi:cell division control protein 6